MYDEKCLWEMKKNTDLIYNSAVSLTGTERENLYQESKTGIKEWNTVPRRQSVKLAYVLITTEPGLEEKVFSELRTVKDVKEVYTVYGVYDVLAKIEADSLRELKDIVSFKIRRLNAVKNTLLMISDKVAGACQNE